MSSDKVTYVQTFIPFDYSKCSWVDNSHCNCGVRRYLVSDNDIRNIIKDFLFKAGTGQLNCNFSIKADRSTTGSNL